MQPIERDHSAMTHEQPPADYQSAGAPMRRGRVVALCAGAIVLVAVAVIATLLVTRSSSSDSAEGWRHDATAEATQLHLVCDQVTVVDANGVKCTLLDASGSVGVETSKDATGQSFFVAAIKDGDPSDCVIVGKGFAVLGTPAELDSATGDRHEFANAHHAYLDGAC